MSRVALRLLLFLDESIRAAAESCHLALLALFTLVVADTLVTLRSGDIFTMAMHPALVTHVGARSVFLAWVFGGVDSGGVSILIFVDESIRAGSASRHFALPAPFTFVVADTLVTLRSKGIFTVAMRCALVTLVGARSAFLAWVFGRVGILSIVDESSRRGGASRNFALTALFTLVVADTLVTLLRSFSTMTMHPTLVTRVGACSTFLAWIFAGDSSQVDSDGWSSGHEQQCKQLHDRVHHCVQLWNLFLLGGE